MSSRGRVRFDESGSAGLLTLGACLLLLSGGLAIVLGTAVTRVHAEVDSAADLAALAVAGVLLVEQTPCGHGREIAEANGAELSRCDIDGLSATVSVAVPLPPVLSRLTGRSQVHSQATAELPTELDF